MRMFRIARALATRLPSPSDQGGSTSFDALLHSWNGAGLYPCVSQVEGRLPGWLIASPSEMYMHRTAAAGLTSVYPQALYNSKVERSIPIVS